MTDPEGHEDLARQWPEVLRRWKDSLAPPPPPRPVSFRLISRTAPVEGLSAVCFRSPHDAGAQGLSTLPLRRQSTVQPSASRRALWMAVAATAASAVATAIWFNPLTTSPTA